MTAEIRHLEEEVPAALAGERVDRVVAFVAGVPRARADALLAAGAVSLDGSTVTARAQRVIAGQVLVVDVPDEAVALPVADTAITLEVVHEDPDLAIIDKPPGLVVHPGAGHETGTLVHGLVARFPEIAAVGQPMRPGIVHRLDQGTSGLLVVARTQRAYDALVGQLRDRTVERTYSALVWGHLEVARGVIDAPIGRSRRRRTAMAVAADGREARTRYEVVAAWRSPAPTTLLTCRLETGRTHQIRVHLAAIGHPVVGDDRYGGDRQGIEAGRPMLHAAHLAFEHPVTGARVEATSPVPSDMAAVLASLSDPVTAIS